MVGDAERTGTIVWDLTKSAESSGSDNRWLPAANHFFGSKKAVVMTLVA